MKRPKRDASPLARPVPPPVDLTGRLMLRLDEVARALGISRRTLERERAAGRFPRPDRTVGRIPLWRPETLQGTQTTKGGKR